MQRTLNNLISTNVFAYFIASFGGRIALDGAVKKAKMFDSLSTFFLADFEHHISERNIHPTFRPSGPITSTGPTTPRHHRQRWTIPASRVLRSLLLPLFVWAGFRAHPCRRLGRRAVPRATDGSRRPARGGEKMQDSGRRGGAADGTSPTCCWLVVFYLLVPL
jgi:hypothetical protein